MKIFLIGFMGAGKTSAGKYVAKRMGIPFFDLDAEIENQIEKSIPEIFQSNGEAHFRSIEQSLLHHYLKLDQSFILACGGGTPCFFDNMTRMNHSGTTIWLDLSPGMLKKRLESAKTERPLLKEKTDLRKYITEKLNDRLEWYIQANIRLQGEEASKKGLLEEVEKLSTEYL